MKNWNFSQNAKSFVGINIHMTIPECLKDFAMDIM